MQAPCQRGWRLPHLLRGDYVSSYEPPKGRTMSIDTSPAAGREPGPAAVDHLAESSLAELARADGVRFLLAMFVDLTGKPCAKLVPVESADELQYEGVGFAGYAVGAIGQQPSDPDLMVVPDLASYTPLPWVREGLALVPLRPARRGETLALRPAGDPQERAGPGAGSAARAVRRRRDRVLPGPSRRRRHPRPGRRQGHRGPSLLRRPRSHPDVRPPHRDLDGDERPRAGQLRQRPRGRQRAVRAELRLRRRPDHRRPRHHRPLPHLRARRAARHDRDVHAQALRRPRRVGHAPAPVVVARRLLPVPRRRGPARLRSRCRRGSTSAAPAATPTGPARTTSRSRSSSCARSPTGRSRST
jgi:hypothetical protein